MQRKNLLLLSSHPARARAMGCSFSLYNRSRSGGEIALGVPREVCIYKLILTSWTPGSTRGAHASARCFLSTQNSPRFCALLASPLLPSLRAQHLLVPTIISRRSVVAASSIAPHQQLRSYCNYHCKHHQEDGIITQKGNSCLLLLPPPKPHVPLQYLYTFPITSVSKATSDLFQALTLKPQPFNPNHRHFHPTLVLLLKGPAEEHPKKDHGDSNSEQHDTFHGDEPGSLSLS